MSPAENRPCDLCASVVLEFETEQGCESASARLWVRGVSEGDWLNRRGIVPRVNGGS
jgi:hypothetical protein